VLGNVDDDAFHFISYDFFDIIELVDQIGYQALKINSILELLILLVVCIGDNQFNAFNSSK